MTPAGPLTAPGARCVFQHWRGRVLVTTLGERFVVASVTRQWHPGFAVARDGSLLVADEPGNVIWRVTAKKADEEK